MFENILTIDFETHGINVGDALPPKPIGVAIKEGFSYSKYYAFAHKGGNNSTFKEVKGILEGLFKKYEVSLGHNYKFDLRILKTYFGIEVKDFTKIHDTMLLLFLYDSNQEKIGLKDCAERLLNWPPSEKEELKEYLLKNQKALGVDVTCNKKKESYFMRQLYYAPPDVVGAYACADVDMTYALFNKLHDIVLRVADEKYCGCKLEDIPKNKVLMREAYDTEREMLFNLIIMEETGIRLNLEGVKEEIIKQEPTLEKIHEWLKMKLMSPNLNFNAPKQVTSALIRNGYLDMNKVKRTPTGEIATGTDPMGKSDLEDAITDKQLLAMYIRQNKIRTCLSNFLKPWYSMASNNNGVLYTTWHQTRNTSTGENKTKGTRTGRLSSTPNFQNISKPYAPLFKHEEHMLPEDSPAELPCCPLGDIPPMPILRSFVIPRYDDHILLSLDYSQQELRILAHFESGELLKLYKENPYLDIHKDTIKLLKEKTGKTMKRKEAKLIAFSIVYGKGDKTLAVDLNTSVEQAKSLKESYFQVFPKLRGIKNTMERLAKNGFPFRTIGGRLNYCQPSRMSKKGFFMNFVKNMINTLCQGSAADASKQATNNYMRMKPALHLLLILVHDEFLLSVPLKEIVIGFKIPKEAMEMVKCDVKLIAEGKESGAMTWAELK